MDWSSVKSPAEAKCYLHMLPPELRLPIFNHAVTDIFNENFMPIRMHYPTASYDLKRLLDPSLGPTANDIKWGLTKLEAVLLRSHRDLYLECLHVRLSRSRLNLDCYERICPRIKSNSPRFYPIFGTDLPISVIQSVKEVCYESPMVGCKHRDLKFFHEYFPCLEWHEKHFKDLKASLKSLADGLKKEDPELDRKFVLEIKTAWYYVDDDYRIFPSPLEKSKIILARKQSAPEQIKRVDVLCKELFGFELLYENCFWREYGKPKPVRVEVVAAGSARVEASDIS